MLSDLFEFTFLIYKNNLNRVRQGEREKETKTKLSDESRDEKILMC